MSKKIDATASERLFKNVFICMKCNAKMRIPVEKMMKKKIKCRRCGSKNFRLKAKESRGQTKAGG